jgi:probable rRNA maturation factor
VAVSYEGRAAREKALGRLLAKVARALLADAEMTRRELSLVLSDDDHMRVLNFDYRGEDKATDVLSFPMDEGAGDVPVILDRGRGRGRGAPPEPLGDIVLSVETVAREAELAGLSRDAMATFLVIHGFCHLRGHDHGAPEEAAAMRAEEDRLLALVLPGQTRPDTPY